MGHLRDMGRLNLTCKVAGLRLFYPTASSILFVGVFNGKKNI